MKTFRYFLNISGALLAGSMMMATSCSDDVALPIARISLETDSIFTPAIEAALNVNLEANCDWKAAFSDGCNWARISMRESTGSETLVLSVDKNEEASSRETILTFSNRQNSAVASLVIRQNSASADGLVTVKELRSLALSDNYTFTAEGLTRGIIVSNTQGGNVFENRTAIISSGEAGNGILVATDKQLLMGMGEEIEINLKGATIGRSSETGQVEIKAASDDEIKRTESSRVEPVAISVSAEELASGRYEGMLVSLEGQVATADMKKSNITGLINIQDQSKNTFGMVTLPSATFAGNAVPSGSGTLTGIAVYYDGKYCVAPRSADDIKMDGARYDGGITYPYVLSFMTENANSKGRYIDFVKDTKVINNSYIMTKDGTGVTLKLNLSKSSNEFLFWADDSGHHNLQLGTFSEGPENDVTFIFPLDEDLPNGFRLQFGWGVQKKGCQNWVVEYSTDQTSWYKVSDDDITFSIPTDRPYGSGKNYFMYSYDIKNPKASLERRKTLYIKLHPANTDGIHGEPVASSGSYGRATAHSCMIIDRIPAFSTSKPAGAVWFQPFDNLTQGADYILGDRLCGLLNFCGDDIAQWTQAQSMGLTGKNVRQRPGYAQIGYVESVATAHQDLKCEHGELQTPAVGAAGNYEVTFDAMAYKNHSVFSKAASAQSADYGGDSRKAVIEVVGGGTINGATTFEISDLDYTKFNQYTFTVKDAKPTTYLKFCGDKDSKFSRWFIDNITINIAK